MPPAFPKADRIELKSPPLELVVCQVRFPTILELAGGQPPAEFQRRIRNSFPVARPHYSGIAMGVQPGGAAQAALAMVWRFDDREADWTVSLGADFLALETKQYKRFEDFIGRFLDLLGELRQMYPIELRERLGLRYLDRIDRLKNPKLPPGWPSLVRSEVIPLRSVRGPNEPQMSSLETRLTFGDHILAVRSSYVDNGYAGATADQLFLDFDCYTEHRDSLEGMESSLREFREIAYNAFRWAIGDLFRFFETAEGRTV
jgi:uncharacterized protein (TIGR04255 family)